MGVASSPLRDRMIFVQGAPRSGTTWLVMLLATHPEIAGTEVESHLFDWGVDRLFDSFEGRNRHLRGLSAYLERPELIDLVRDTCDAVFTAMRSHVSADAEPEFIVEKTPTSLPQASLDLQRKVECYPDAWYLHIVRDGDAVTESLMRAPWIADRSAENCNRIWRECVGWTRHCLGDHPRYRELSYEEMRTDPGKVAGELFRWLGVDSGEAVLRTVRSLSRERFSEQGALPVVSKPDPRLRSRARRAAGELRRTGLPGLDRLTRQAESENAWSPVAHDFARAIQGRDAEALSAITAEGLTVAYRGSDGDRTYSGDEAREALLEIGGTLFSRGHVSERWGAAQGGPREWWTPAPGQPFWTLFYSAVDGDATRVDLAFGLSLESDAIADVVVISAGELTGRPVGAR